MEKKNGGMILKRSKFKVFSEHGTSFNVVLIPYKEDISYFSFLREQHQKGYRQIIVNSEMMIKLLKVLTSDYSLSIVNIEFMEDNIELNNQISYLVDGVNDKKQGAINALIAQLSLISEESSIDIKSIEIKKTLRQNIKNPLYLKIQSNGIISTNNENSEFLSTVVVKEIEDYFW